MKLLLTLAITAFGTTFAQLIGMKLCADTACSAACTSWTSNSGSCSICIGGSSACSSSNPSSVTTSNSITFYSDSTCSSSISGFPISLDGTCHSIGTASYQATNLSAAIGIGVGVSLAVILIATVIGIICCKRRGTCCFKKNLATGAGIPQTYSQPQIGYGQPMYVTQPPIYSK